MNGTIYKATNLINGKIYIGQTTNFEKRKKNHLNQSYNHKQKHYNYYFHNAIRVHGDENFKWEILLDNIQSREELDKLEIETIKKYNSNNKDVGYNMTEGGERVTLTEEIRKRISQGQIRRFQ